MTSFATGHSMRMAAGAFRRFVGPARAASLAVAVTSMLAPAAHAGDVSIMPSLLELSVEPGRDVTTVVRISYTKDGPDDTQPIRIMLSTESWDMDATGQLTYTAADTIPYSLGSWARFSPSEAELEPGQTMYVRLSVIVPEDATPGEYRSALIAQPRSPYRPVEKGHKRLEFRYRLASILYVEVPPVAPELELTDLVVASNPERPVVVPTFANPGSCHLRITDSYQIFALDGTATAPIRVRESEEAGVVLPGRTRTLARRLPTDLPPGEYRLLYQADAGDQLPILLGETSFTVRPGEALPVVASVD